MIWCTVFVFCFHFDFIHFLLISRKWAKLFWPIFPWWIIDNLILSAQTCKFISTLFVIFAFCFIFCCLLWLFVNIELLFLFFYKQSYFTYFLPKDKKMNCFNVEQICIESCQCLTSLWIKLCVSEVNIASVQLKSRSCTLKKNKCFTI